MENKYKRVAALRTGPAFTAYIQEHQIDLPFDAEIKSGDELAVRPKSAGG